MVAPPFFVRDLRKGRPASKGPKPGHRRVATEQRASGLRPIQRAHPLGRGRSQAQEHRRVRRTAAGQESLPTGACGRCADPRLGRSAAGFGPGTARELARPAPRRAAVSGCRCRCRRVVHPGCTGHTPSVSRRASVRCTLSRLLSSRVARVPGLPASGKSRRGLRDEDRVPPDWGVGGGRGAFPQGRPGPGRKPVDGRWSGRRRLGRVPRRPPRCGRGPGPRLIP